MNLSPFPFRDFDSHLAAIEALIKDPPNANRETLLTLIDFEIEPLKYHPQIDTNTINTLNRIRKLFAAFHGNAKQLAKIGGSEYVAQSLAQYVIILQQSVRRIQGL